MTMTGRTTTDSGIDAGETISRLSSPVVTGVDRAVDLEVALVEAASEVGDLVALAGAVLEEAPEWVGVTLAWAEAVTAGVPGWVLALRRASAGLRR